MYALYTDQKILMIYDGKEDITQGRFNSVQEFIFMFFFMLKTRFYIFLKIRKNVKKTLSKS